MLPFNLLTGLGLIPKPNRFNKGLCCGPLTDSFTGIQHLIWSRPEEQTNGAISSLQDKYIYGVFPWLPLLGPSSGVSEDMNRLLLASPLTKTICRSTGLILQRKQAVKTTSSLEAVKTIIHSKLHRTLYWLEMAFKHSDLVFCVVA